MKKIIFFVVMLITASCVSSVVAANEKIPVKFFFSPHCKHCIDIKEKFLPEIRETYADLIEIELLNTEEAGNLKLLFSLEKRFGNSIRTPAILIGNELLIGSAEIRAGLVPLIEHYRRSPPISVLELENIDLVQKFNSFSVHTVILAGLIDGINPCAFTVIIFFVSFLTLMGYKKSEVGLIGGGFVLSVFCTYLAIGLGLFRGFYALEHITVFITGTYYIMAGFCFILAYLSLRDFFIYTKTKSSEGLTVKLPKPIRARIHALITSVYRTQKESHARSRFSLLLSAIAVGFLVSLLEAVCTGQVYVPTIVLILQEPALRAQAIGYLLLYNGMFIIPLLAILILVLVGISSKTIEDFFRKRIALAKFLMGLLFLGLGIFLIVGLR